MNRHFSFWAMATGPETARLLRTIVGDASADQLEHIVGAAIAGPPRDYYREDLSDEAFAGIVRRESWLKLRSIAEVNPEIGDAAKAALALLDEEFDAPSPAERGGFAVYRSPLTPPESPLSAADLLVRPVRAVARFLLDNQGDGWGSRSVLSEWRSASHANPRRALDVLYACPVEEPRGSIFATFLLANTDQLLRSEDLTRLARLLDAPSLSREEAYSLSAFVRGRASMLGEQHQPAFWWLWRMAKVEAKKQPVDNRNGWLTTSLNHPMGILADAAIGVLRAEHDLPLKQNIAWALGALQAMCLDLDAPSGPAQAMVGHNLALLHALVPDWAEDFAVPLFAWDTGTSPGPAWQAFLFSPRWTVRLFELLKPDLMLIPSKVAEIGDAMPQVGVALAAASLERTNLIRPDEVATSLSTLPPAARVGAARWLRARGRAIAPKANRTSWAKQLIIWLNGSWPKSRDLNTGEVSQSLCQAVLSAQAEFPDGLQWLLEFVERPPHAWALLEDLDGTTIPVVYPSAAARFTNWILQEGQAVPPPARRILDRILSAAANAEDPQIAALRQVVQTV